MELADATMVEAAGTEGGVVEVEEILRRMRDTAVDLTSYRRALTAMRLGVVKGDIRAGRAVVQRGEHGRVSECVRGWVFEGIRGLWLRAAGKGSPREMHSFDWGGARTVSICS
jgi:hypothetical protein